MLYGGSAVNNTDDELLRMGDDSCSNLQQHNKDIEELSLSGKPSTKYMLYLRYLNPFGRKRYRPRRTPRRLSRYVGRLGLLDGVIAPLGSAENLEEIRQNVPPYAFFKC